jgi:geranylgeranyl pyrophosphate synthase
MGKGIGKDSGAGKQTFPAAVGIEASRQAAGEAAEQAIASLDALPDAPDDLAVLARFVVDRQH